MEFCSEAKLNHAPLLHVLTIGLHEEPDMFTQYYKPSGFSSEFPWSQIKKLNMMASSNLHVRYEFINLLKLMPNLISLELHRIQLVDYNMGRKSLLSLPQLKYLKLLGTSSIHITKPLEVLKAQCPETSHLAYLVPILEKHREESRELGASLANYALNFIRSSRCSLNDIVA
ncbi:hypothetical protein BDQ17DRAFT_1432088 [Cyathus striatus]|nr:hypothetical protein BDQ17DRAFT_1432088 [Cyathus striatus]